LRPLEYAILLSQRRSMTNRETLMYRTMPLLLMS
jgi:hypothetical protein